jgi:hypothetical protein
MNSMVLQRRKAKSPRRRKRAKGQRGTRTSARGHEDRLRHGCNDWSGVVHIPAMGAPSKASAWGASRRHVSLAAETRIHHHHVSCGCELRRRFMLCVHTVSYACVDTASGLRVCCSQAESVRPVPAIKRGTARPPEEEAQT